MWHRNLYFQKLVPVSEEKVQEQLIEERAAAIEEVQLHAYGIYIDNQNRFTRGLLRLMNCSLTCLAKSNTSRYSSHCMHIIFSSTVTYCRNTLKPYLIIQMNHMLKPLKPLRRLLKQIDYSRNRIVQSCNVFISCVYMYRVVDVNSVSTCALLLFNFSYVLNCCSQKYECTFVHLAGVMIFN